MPRLAGDQRRELTHGIAVERLDLQDTRTALGEQLRAERNRDELAELDDLDPGEGAGDVHRSARVARGRVCYSLGP